MLDFRADRKFWVLKYLLMLLVLSFLVFSYAQPTVLVNGVQLELVDNTTVNGIDYVAIDELSAALGATFNISASGTSLQIEFAGQFVLMPIFTTVQEVQNTQQAIDIRRFGISETLASTAALYVSNGVNDGFNNMPNTTVLVPLKPLIVALGGSVDYIPEVNSVIAVFERAELAMLASPQRNSSVERFVLNLSVPVNYKVQDMKSLSVLNILFSQTNSQLSSQNLTGKGFQKALFRNFAGDIEFRLELRQGYKADIFTSPPEGTYKGINVIVDVLSEEAFAQRYASAEASQAARDAATSVGSSLVNAIGIQAANTDRSASISTSASSVSGTQVSQVSQVSAIGSTPLTDTTNVTHSNSVPATVNVADIGEPVSITARSSHIVLDPVPVSNANLNTADVSFDLVAGIAAELQRNGFSSSITRMKGDFANPESRRNAGLGAAVFISISQADIPAGTYNLYYLGEVDTVDTLDLAVRRNAESALRNTNFNQEDETAALRRQVLLNISSNVDEAANLAQSMSRSLSAKGYQLANIEALPLYILGAAVGKGIVVEFSQEDFATPQLQIALLESILQLGFQ